MGYCPSSNLALSKVMERFPAHLHVRAEQCQGMITIESGRLQGRQLHPHHMVRQPRSRSAASLPIAGLDTAGQPIPPGVAPNGMPPNVHPGGGSASAAVAAAAARRESAVSVTSLSVYDAMGGGGGGQMTGADHNLTFLQYM